MKTILAVTLLVIVVLIGMLMMRLGAFKEVVLTEGMHDSAIVIYKQHVGAYHKIVPVIEEVEKWAKAHGESCELSFGEYIDNPDLVAEDRLRSNGGCFVSKPPSAPMPDGFKVRTIPAHLYVVADFDGAPSIGPAKVYPRARELMAAKGYEQSGPTFEIYKILPGQAVHTTYHFPIVKKGEKDPTPVGELASP